MFTINKFQRALLPVAAAAAVLGMVTACGADTSGEAKPSASSVAIAPAPTASAPGVVTATSVVAQSSTPVKTQGWLKIFAGTAQAGVNAVQLKVTTDPVIGQYVTDGAGRSLYRFDKDSAQPPTSNCAGQCAVTWPPLTVNREQALYAAGVDPQTVGFIERADGSCQITIGGWPVYYFGKDAKAGDLLGQGVGGTWFAVAPNGGKAVAK